MEGQHLGPWAELRRREHIRLGFGELPDATGGAVHIAWPDGRVVILLDPRLTQTERRCALAHEIAHDDRGGGCASCDDAPPAWRAVVARDEALADRRALDMLIDWPRLIKAMEIAADLGDAVTASEIADDQNVTVEVAARAMGALLRDWSEGYGRAG